MGPQRIPRAAFLAGSLVLLVTALAHMGAHVMSVGAPPLTPEEGDVREMMARVRFPVAGVERTYQDFHTAFSLYFAIFLLLVGLLGILIGSRGAGAGLIRPAAAIYTVCLSIALFVTFRWAVWPPAVFLAAAIACFLASLATSLLHRPHPGPPFFPEE